MYLLCQRFGFSPTNRHDYTTGVITIPTQNLKSSPPRPQITIQLVGEYDRTFRELLKPHEDASKKISVATGIWSSR